MKTFNKSDLITWSNLDKAEVGKEYYFASCLSDIQNRVNVGKCKFNELNKGILKWDLQKVI